MKSTKLIATVAIASLMITAGSASAAGAHDAYNNAFFGDSGGHPNGNVVTPHSATSAGRNSIADGHEAYSRAFYGSSGVKPQAVTGKAAFGASSSNADGHAAYSRAFHGD